MLIDLRLQAFRKLLRAQVVPARVGRDREARGNRDPERGHLGEADALSAQEVLAPLGRFVEVEDVAPAHRALNLPMSSGTTLCACP